MKTTRSKSKRKLGTNGLLFKLQLEDPTRCQRVNILNLDRLTKLAHIIIRRSGRPLTIQSCANLTSFAHDSSCKSSQSVLQRSAYYSTPSAAPVSVRPSSRLPPKRVEPWWINPPQPPNHSPPRDRLFSSAAAATCSLNFQPLLWLKCQQLALSTLSQEPSPSSTVELLQTNPHIILLWHC